MSLTKTVEVIIRDASADVLEYIIVVCEKTKPESMQTIRELQERLPNKIVVHHQHLPFAGGAIQEAFQLARGSHTIMMASDLETEPADVPRLIAESKKHPGAVIATSRWRQGGSFHGYSKIKLVANWLFQKLFSTLYGTNLTDMTFGYRLYPTELIQSICWEELRHPFFFETVIKPLRLGVPVIEIPTTWGARIEGESHNSFFRNFAYFAPGFRIRFADPNKMLKASSTNKP